MTCVATMIFAAVFFARPASPLLPSPLSGFTFAALLAVALGWLIVWREERRGAEVRAILYRIEADFVEEWARRAALEMPTVHLRTVAVGTASVAADKSYTQVGTATQALPPDNVIAFEMGRRAERARRQHEDN